MKYLITGGFGFIGRNLIEKLKNDPSNDITVVDVVSEKIEGINYVQERIEIIPFDLFNGIDVVIHLACRSGVETSTNDPLGTFHENVYGTLRCLEGARKYGVKRFIFASSGGTVLGEQNEALKETLVPNPSSVYGASKLACEGYCKAYYKSYGLETVILRFSNVYGPYSDRKTSNLISGFIINGILGVDCFINGDGNVIKDYIYVKDLIKVITATTTLPGVAGEIFQVATGKAFSINEIAGKLSMLSRKYLMKDLIIRNRKSRTGDISYTCDISKLQAKFLFDPGFTLDKGLDETFRWFNENWR